MTMQARISEWKRLRGYAKLMSDIGQHALAAELMRRALAAKNSE